MGGRRTQAGLWAPEDTYVQVTGPVAGRAEGAEEHDTRKSGTDPLNSGRGEDRGRVLLGEGACFPRCWWRGARTVGTQTDTCQDESRNRCGRYSSMASSFLAEWTQSHLSKDLRSLKEWSRTAVVRSDQERKDQGSAGATQREAGRCKCGRLLRLRSGVRGGLQSCMCFVILSLIPGEERVGNDCPLARPWELSHLLRPLFRASPPHSPESVYYSLSPAQSVGFRGMAWGCGQLLADLQDPEPRGPRAQEQAANRFPLLCCRNTMSSTPPWPGARPTPRGLTACGPAWCTWSRCAPAPWPAMESSVARCASRLWRMVRGRRVTWDQGRQSGEREPQEALVTAEMPTANWIPVALPWKGLPPGGPAFPRQSICLKPGRVLDI